MRHGGKQGRTQLVGLFEVLGARRVGLQLAAFHREAQLAGERVQHRQVLLADPLA